MPQTLGAMVCTIGMMSACKSGIDFANIQESTASDDERFKVDSIKGYYTFFSLFYFLVQ